MRGVGAARLGGGASVKGCLVIIFYPSNGCPRAVPGAFFMESTPIKKTLFVLLLAVGSWCVLSSALSSACRTAVELDPQAKGPFCIDTSCDACVPRFALRAGN